MRQLQDICTQDMEEIAKSLRKSTREHEMRMEKEGRTMPDPFGNRKQRRAAEAKQRKLVSA